MYKCSQWHSGKILAAIDIGVEDKGPGFDSRARKVSPLCSDSNVGTSSTQRCELPVCVQKTGFTVKTTYIQTFFGSDIFCRYFRGYFFSSVFEFFHIEEKN
jgi:hypothetical protein